MLTKSNLSVQLQGINMSSPSLGIPVLQSYSVGSFRNLPSSQIEVFDILLVKVSLWQLRFGRGQVSRHLIPLRLTKSSGPCFPFPLTQR